MSFLDYITAENFDSHFEVKSLLSGSVFYPASGIDGRAIECMYLVANSFIHVDYSTSLMDVKDAMRNDFCGVGYRVIGIKHVDVKKMIPKVFFSRIEELNEHEKSRLNSHYSIHDRFQGIGFEPFALWAIYELSEDLTKKTKGKNSRFSLLHIGGEACAVFESLYLENGINPLAVSIINPSEGFGDNWTIFTDPEFRLYQMIQKNTVQNDVSFPEYLITNIYSHSKGSFWPHYSFQSSKYLPNDSVNMTEVTILKRD